MSEYNFTVAGIKLPFAFSTLTFGLLPWRILVVEAVSFTIEIASFSPATTSLL